MEGLEVVAYVRVSTQEQAADGLSLDAQRSRIESWAAATGAVLVDVIEDAGVSGARPLALRPGGARVAALLEHRDPDVDAVAVTQLDRLGRNAAEALTLLHRFSQGRVGLASVLDRLDLTTPQGRAMAGVAAVFGQLERELIGQRTAEALGELRDQGRVYGPVPFGFDRDGDFLVANRDEQRIVKKILGMRQAGVSYQLVADYLNEEGISAKRGGGWSAAAVRSVALTTMQRAERML